MKPILPAASVCLVCVFGLLSLARPALADPKSNPPPKLTVQETPIARETTPATSFAPIVKKVAPSVVNIYSTMTIRDRTSMLNPFDDPFFRRFFGEDDDGTQRRSRPHKAQSLGSGVIVSQEGYILTA